ncbi:MAG: serine protease [Desmonostoc vinosum HA7617-LM4]|jgi:tetratricopeptide (TPR) repeat protein|nr:serine protease [Desmonostoc vinosum HA7617-LM4]
MIKFSGELSILLGAAIVVVQPQIVAALTPAEVNAIAQAITVRIDGSNTGSGVIIGRQGNDYTVITNWHVLREKGTYTIQKPDGTTEAIKYNLVKQLPGVDLAVLQFNSNQNYQVAEPGNSDQITGGRTIHVAGWADPGPVIVERSFQFLTGQISGRVPKPKDGYALVYTVNALPGMSGGPILDEQGKLVGIHGLAEVDQRTGNVSLVLGIPIKTYLNMASAATPPNTTLASTNSQLSNFQAYIDRARERIDKGDEQGAKEDFQQAQKLDTIQAEKEGLSLAQEAAQLAQFQQNDLALPRAKIATYLVPNNDKVWLLLGGLYLQTRKYDQALIALNKAKFLKPDNADVLFAIGSTYFQTKLYREAEDYYKAGLKIKPTDTNGLFDLGNTYWIQSKSTDAIAYYQKVLSQDAKFWPAINNIGLIKYERGDIEGAIRQWRSAIAVDEKAAEPLLALAVALYSKNEQSLGLTLGKQAITIDKRYGDIEFLKENLWGDRLLANTKKFLQILGTK